MPGLQTGNSAATRIGQKFFGSFFQKRTLPSFFFPYPTFGYTEPTSSRLYGGDLVFAVVTNRKAVQPCLDAVDGSMVRKCSFIGRPPSGDAR
jgi:hypothetical protein